MKCFYHNDMDGHCSAAIVKRFVHNGTSKSVDDLYYEMDYDRDFPFDDIEPGERVFIVDFSLQREGEFERLLEITNDVWWIDHHKTSIEKHKHISGRMKGIQDTSKAGCVLAWEYLFRYDKVPLVVELLADYDIWAFKHGDMTRDLQAGFKVEDTYPLNRIWDSWFDGNIDYIIEQGKLIRKYQQVSRKKMVESNGFYAELEGYRCVCLNNGARTSQYFESVDPKTYDLMVSFYCNDKGWTVSLYNEKKIDATPIAVKYGGGGHPGACGFQCKQLFLKDGKIEVVK